MFSCVDSRVVQLIMKMLRRALNEQYSYLRLPQRGLVTVCTKVEKSVDKKGSNDQIHLLILSLNSAIADRSKIA